jgi:hypothetical protein
VRAEGVSPLVKITPAIYTWETGSGSYKALVSAFPLHVFNSIYIGDKVTVVIKALKTLAEVLSPHPKNHRRQSPLDRRHFALFGISTILEQFIVVWLLLDFWGGTD